MNVSQQDDRIPAWHGTTILSVRKGDSVVIAGDGQVTLGQTVIKASARKVRPLGDGSVIAGFAGATADAMTLFERLEAKLFGGARLIDGLTDVGRQNAEFAQRFLTAEGIRHAGGSLLGEHGRKVQFWPVSGRARQSLMERESIQVFDAERRIRPVPPVESDGSVELF